MGDKINNVGAMLNNPKQRNIYIMFAGVAIVTVVGGLFFATRGTDVAAQASAQVASVPAVESIPGQSDSARYNNSVHEHSVKKADEALLEDKTYLPPPVNKDSYSTESPIDALDKEIKAKKEAEEKERIAQEQEAVVQPEPVNQPQPIAEITPAPVYVPVAQPVAPKPVKHYGSDEDYILLTALSGLTNIKAPRSEFDYAGQRIEADSLASSSGEQAYSIGNEQTAQSSGEGILMSKAGTILNAVLETNINSDEPSPVLAKIVSGELKGTKLIGQISQTGEKVVITFNLANIPGVPTSTKIESVAIDPATSRTALASDVNRHYFLRYGVLLGAAFLGSYAEALSDQNSTTTVTPEGSVVTTKGKKTSKEINREAVGGMGKELAEETRTQIRGIKPTITVNAGIPIGILIMEDLYIKQ